MGQIINLFYENPNKEFYLRQIARITNIPKSTVARKLKQLLKENLILKKKSEPYNYFIANQKNIIYRLKKKFYIIEKIYKSGLIEYLEKKTLPKAIVLFGSCAKGEFDKDSDIDIFINSSEIQLNLKDFHLKHKINVFFEANVLKLSPELRQNILNGVLLYGMIKYE